MYKMVKQMKKKGCLLVLLVFLLSCKNETDKKQFEFAGGEFSMCLGEEPSDLIARNVTDVHSATVINQVMEGLVSFNSSDMKIKPQLASSWQISADLLTYRFKLRTDVLFHDCDFLSASERKLTVADVVYTFEKIAEKDAKGNSTAAYTSFFSNAIKGMDEFHAGKAKSISGIKTDGNTIIMSLTQPDANFLYKLANVSASIVSKKIGQAQQEELMIGTGPFMFKGISDGEQRTITLPKNPAYYLEDKEGNSLPYLNQLVFIIENKQLNQLDLFENGKVDFISALPSSRISAMLEGRIKDFNGVPPLFILRNNPLLATNYYFFNMKDKRFSDARVRKAFNYAINRAKITQEVLNGQAYEDGVYGIVPPISSIFRGYDFKNIKTKAYDYDPELAKSLLAAAGFPEGKGFGSVQLRVNYGDIHTAVAEEIAKQVYSTLGIIINIDASSFEQKTSDADFLRGDLFRIAWFADYLSPESFLMNFYGKIVPSSMDEPSKINQSRYTNPTFDKIFEQAKKEAKLSDRLRLFAEAEEELMKDPPFISLWYNGDIQIVKSNVRNFYENPLNYYSFREVYKKDWTKQEYEKRIKSN